MEEKVIIKGEFTKINLLAILFGIGALYAFLISVALFNNCSGGYHTYFSYCFGFLSPEGIACCFYLGVFLTIAAIYTWLYMRDCELVVTDKRVYGKTSFAKAIDLPYDMISSVGTCFPMGISTATSSGIIKFWLLSNQKEVYKSISDLLKERQPSINIATINAGQSSADELKKFKELYDEGIITQEEYELKKKQLIGS